jgi:hypothetical protein
MPKSPELLVKSLIIPETDPTIPETAPEVETGGVELGGVVTTGAVAGADKFPFGKNGSPLLER